MVSVVAMKVNMGAMQLRNIDPLHLVVARRAWHVRVPLLTSANVFNSRHDNKRTPHCSQVAAAGL